MNEPENEMSIRITEDGKMIVSSGDKLEVVGAPVEGKAAESPSNVGFEVPEEAKQQMVQMAWALGKKVTAMAAEWKDKGGIKVGAVKADKRHPYVVLVAGVPILASSSAMPERLIVMLTAGGLNPQTVAVVDLAHGTLGLLAMKHGE